MPAAKKAARKQSAPKEKWLYTLDNDDETYATYPSRDAALKDAKQSIKDNMYYDNGAKGYTINLFQLAEVVKVAVEVQEVETVVVKKIQSIKEIK